MYKVYGTRDMRAISGPSSYKRVGLFIHTSMILTIRGVKLRAKLGKLYGLPNMECWDTFYVINIFIYYNNIQKSSRDYRVRSNCDHIWNLLHIA